jgi:imidazoleglycerol-phosphate dehydratase
MAGPLVRLTPAAAGRASVSTGLPAIDHLLGVLAEAGRFELAVESAPAGALADEIAAVGEELGRAAGGLLAPGAVAAAIAPADEALAQAALEVGGRPAFYDNFDLSVGGLGTDVVDALLRSFAEGAGITLHVRLLEGENEEHVLEAIFKALGLALAQAVTPDPGG